MSRRDKAFFVLLWAFTISLLVSVLAGSKGDVALVKGDDEVGALLPVDRNLLGNKDEYGWQKFKISIVEKPNTPQHRTHYMVGFINLDQGSPLYGEKMIVGRYTEDRNAKDVLFLLRKIAWIAHKISQL
jgi:hypothetical protein